MTGGRLKRLEKYLSNETFLLRMAMEFQILILTKRLNFIMGTEKQLLFLQ